MNIHDTPRAGLLIGHQAIAAFLNIDPRLAATLLGDRTIPAFTVGDLVIARRHRLEPLLASTPPRPSGPPLNRLQSEADEARQRRGRGALEGLGEIAAYLNATHRHVRAMIAAGMPCNQTAGGLRASTAEIDTWIAGMEGTTNG